MKRRVWLIMGLFDVEPPPLSAENVLLQGAPVIYRAPKHVAITS